MKLVFAAAGLPIGDHVVVTDRQWRSRAARRSTAAVAALGLAGVRQAGAGGVEHRDHHGWTSPDELARRGRGGAACTTRRWSSRPASSGREIECAVLGGRDGGRRRPRAGSGSAVVGAPRVLRLRGQVPRRGDVALVCPADCRPRWRREMPRPGGPGVRGRWAARAWPGSTSSTPTTAGAGQRDQHDAGVHAVSMYPQLWQHSGVELPRARSTSSLQLALGAPPACADARPHGPR